MSHNFWYRQLFCQETTRLLRRGHLQNEEKCKTFSDEKSIKSMRFYDKENKFIQGKYGEVVYYLCEYMPEYITGHDGRELNPFLDIRSNQLVLAFKNGNPAAIDKVAESLTQVLPGDCTLIAVPPSKIAKNGTTPTHKLISAITATRKDIIDGSLCLVRNEDIKSAHEGGKRSIKQHLDTIDLKDIDRIKGQNVLILDDVTTSGKSFIACYEKVIAAEPKSVAFFAVGKTIDLTRKDIGFIIDIDGTLFDTEQGPIKQARENRDWSEMRKLAEVAEPCEGAIKLFEKIRNIGANYYLVTSSPRFYAEILAKKLDLDKPHIIAYKDTQCHKPNPQPYMLAKQKMGIYEPFIIAIGDRSTDILPAKQLGMTSVLIGDKVTGTLSDYRYSTLEKCVEHFSDITKLACRIWDEIANEYQKYTQKAEKLAYMLAFADIKGISQWNLISYREKLLTIRSIKEAYGLFKSIRTRYKDRISIPELTFEEFAKKVYASRKALAEQRKQGIHFLLFDDPEYKKCFAGATNPPLYVFYKGNKDALLQNGVSIVNWYLREDYPRRISKVFSQRVFQKKWNVIIASVNDIAECYYRDNKTEAHCILVKNSPLDQIDSEFCNKVIENNGCIVSLYPIGEREKHCNWYETMMLQISLSKGAFVFGYGKLDENHNAKYRDNYYSTIFRMNRPLAFCQCDPDQLKKYPCMQANNDFVNDKRFYAINKNLNQTPVTFLEYCLKQNSVTITWTA